MKKILLIFSIMLTSSSAFAQVNKQQSLQTDSVYYTCVMHPEIYSATPGKCPKCGMTLVKKIIKVEKPVPPKNNTGSPKNGNEQTPNKNPPPKITTQQTDSVYYTCVMHPEIHSASPGKCPKCGMTLVMKKIKIEKPSNNNQNNNNADNKKDTVIELHTNELPVKDSIRIEPKEIESPKTSYHHKVVRYDLFVNDTTVNYSGARAKAIAINGQIPAPTLYFTEGDTAEIYIHNLMNTETSIHWHGLILPNNQDGVPYLTYTPIKALSTFKYRFPIVQNGTYWYHAHTGLQEQIGLYGAFIIHKKTEDTIPEYTILLSDWTNENPMEVLRSLKIANDWYAIKKHSTQNYGAALFSGHLGTKMQNEWKRMFAMDVSDVYYNAFLVNGHKEITATQFKAGQKIHLRIVNGSASTYFWLQFAGSKLNVVASDGEDVVPVDVDRMLIAVAETYDVIVTIPDNMSYEFKATAEDRTKSTSLWLGEGMKMQAPVLPTLKYFVGMKMMNSMMKFNGQMDAMGMKMSNQQMDMNSVMYPEITGEAKNKKKKQPVNDKMQMNMSNPLSYAQEKDQHEIITLNYGMLRATENTSLPTARTIILNFTLTGNMNRYQWSINNTTLGDTDKILIHKGENVRIILNNQTMMRHPMHLHGQFFRVLNGQGDYAPLKNVLDIMPMEIDTIEFAANYTGDWFFHCHILYHMMSGMGRVFSVPDSIPNIELSSVKNAWHKFTKDENMWHFSTQIPIQSNGVFPKVMLMNRHYNFDAMGMIDYKMNFESETHFARYFGQHQYLKLYIGSDIRMISESASHISDTIITTIESRIVVTGGAQYLLPMFIQTDLRIDHTGHIRFQISRNDLALTSRLRLDAMWNTEREYEIGLRYIALKRLSLSANYDSHFGLGGGITFTY